MDGPRVLRFRWLAALVVGCATGEDAPDASRPCATVSDCDDRVACTRDLCLVDGTCEHNPMGSDCIVPRACSSAAQCDDGVACTRDLCLVEGFCENSPQASRCSEGSRCDAVRGCVTSAPPADVPPSGQDAPAPDGVSAPDVVVVDVPSPPPDAPREDLPTVDATAAEVVSFDAAPEAAVDAGGMDAAVDTAPDVIADVMPPDAAPDPRSGTYTLAMPARYTCVDDVSMLAVVSVNTSAVRLALSGAGASATWDGAPATLTGPAPTGTMFRVQAILPSKDCPTGVVLSGTFTDATHFTGALELVFVGFGCFFTSCENQRIAVTGTRAP